jgi:hypothetical protein
MEVSRLAGVEVTGVSVDIPAQGSDVAGVGLFEVDVGKFHSWIGDKYSPKSLLNILEIASSSKVVKTT